jgi:NhaA family Na+:H+ antiporter
MKKALVDKWILDPASEFFKNSSLGGIFLFSAAIMAILFSNSPWAEAYHHLWETEVGVTWGSFSLYASLHHWINDGLMAIFFFVIGLELKREIVGGELRNPKNAILPIAAGLGGMLIPALVFVLFNQGQTTLQGWGIPMATDIAFALGVLYLLGNRVPPALKLFLTVLAIADDLGAVLVIAIFYTSDISFANILIGILFMGILILGNVFGIRSPLFYGIFGIGGLWLAFLLSGVHATVAAVLAAFTIPANVKISEENFIQKMNLFIRNFTQSKPNQNALVTYEQLNIIDNIRNYTKAAITPLQQLEHQMHPLVIFIVMPIFALANAGVDLSGNILQALLTPISMGIFFGLILGKTIGITGFSYLCIKLGLAKLPKGIHLKHILGASLLAGIGFTMSLFIAGLAFPTNPEILNQAKLSTLFGSLVAGFSGFLLLRK